MSVLVELSNWLIARMGWVYKYITGTLGLPSFIGYTILSLLVVLFFYEIYDIYQHRNKGNVAFMWLLVVLFLPLGTLVYIAFGRPHIRKATVPVVRQSNMPMSKQKKAATTMGSIVGAIALGVGAIALVFFILIGIALIQCANDPKCM